VIFSASVSNNNTKHKHFNDVEKEKFTEIIKEHQKLIYKICHSYCFNSESRKDLQQEILIQLWKSFSKYDGRVKISTFIYRIAINTAISFYRNDCKYSKRKTDLDETVISLADTNTEINKDENLQILHDFIRQLNEMDKALILLYLEGYKHKEMSEVLGLSETNVATKINRIKSMLKNNFNNL